MNRIVVLFTLLVMAPAFAEPPTAFTLDNGLRVRLVPAAGDKQVVVLLGVKAGFFDEPAERPHLAHVTEHLVCLDVPEKHAKVVAEWAKANKANGETMADGMYFDLHVTPDELDKALDVQAARLGPLAFSRETLLREIPRTLGEVDFVERATFPSAGKFALAPAVQAMRHAKTDQPIRQRTAKLTVDDATALHRRLFRPDRVVLVVVGEFDVAAVRKAVEAKFGPLKNPKEAVAVRPAIKPGDHKAAWDMKTRHVIIGWPIPPADHADHPALTLAAVALMERLLPDAGFRKLAQLGPQLNDAAGVFVAGAQARPDADLDAVKSAMLDAFGGMTWTEADLRRRCSTLDRMLLLDADVEKGPLPKGVSRTAARANQEIQRLLKTLAWGDVDAYRKRLDAVTPAQAKAAVGKHLNSKAACVVRVGE